MCCLLSHFYHRHAPLFCLQWLNSLICLWILLWPIIEKESGETFSFKLTSLSKSSLGHIPVLCSVSYVVVGSWNCPSRFHTALPSSTEAGRQAAQCGLSTSQELVSEARHRGFYSPVYFYIIESVDCFKPGAGHSCEATCRFDESIYCSGTAWSKGTLAGLDPSNGYLLYTTAAYLFIAHIYMLAYTYRSSETCILCITYRTCM